MLGNSGALFDSFEVVAAASVTAKPTEAVCKSAVDEVDASVDVFVLLDDSFESINFRNLSICWVDSDEGDEDSERFVLVAILELTSFSAWVRRSFKEAYSSLRRLTITFLRIFF